MSTLPNTAAPNRRPENLALIFQELLTVGERLRSNRQSVTDARSFRAQIWEAVRQAAEEARQRGYSGEDVELASFAAIAFLDESILNLRSPIFADWPRQPLQEERYGHHIAGEIFFQNLQKLLARSDSQELADLLEIYQLCLLLGFAGRYSMGGRGELRVFLQQTAEKINRIRRPSLAISPEAALPNEPMPSLGHDPWVKPILIGAIACFVLVIGLFVIFQVLLQSGVSNLRTATGV
ncbi:MAG TPA: DotU family type IV/VI secretion system protein [Bryobacteraceae bacterium]|nr:DotU family type IV/VI secretion system protein [Bryobacteraceae bacterium]